MHSNPQQLSLALIEQIRDQIIAQGSISFHQYMHMALYQPGLGYYSGGLHKIGSEGDFITASTIGQLFAKTISQQFIEIMQNLSQPIILELGAGTGQFAYDVLQALNSAGQLPDNYYILEVSADFKQQQKTLLAQLPDNISERIIWLDKTPEFEFNGIVFANEVIDALPVEVFRCHDNSYQRLMIDWQDGFNEIWADFPQTLLQQLHDKQLQLPENYRSEFIPHLPEWLHSISHSLVSGCMLFIDYGFHRKGYYHPQRNSGTLVCHQRHRAHFNPLIDTGLQDITSFVDFTALAEAADTCGLEVVGYTTQSNFLMDLDIHLWLDNQLPYDQYYDLSNELKKLVMPNQMGEKFKVMALCRNYPNQLQGFKNNNLHLL
ncbi:class I SAM-dependent methyltransferase [Marinicella sp. W31]|uniref:class I SAM-dependent methyltransferase n=1 Tax=Marinicella sp. W31 TaxID=3023713 RepID=UPI003758049D